MPFTLVEQAIPPALELRLAIAQRVRQARAHGRMRQGHAARALGLHRNTLQAMERGAVGIKAEQVVCMAQLYGVGVRWLLEGR